MDLTQLANVGEFIGGVAVLVTLIYLAVQLRQNTRAMRSSTFQQISAQMGQNVETVTTNPELADIFVKFLSGDRELTPSERVRLQGLFVMSLRRIEAVYVQRALGSIDGEMADGFEKSLLPLLLTPEGAEIGVSKSKRSIVV